MRKIFYYLFSFLFINFLFFLNVHILKWGSSPYSTEFFWIMKIYAFLIILSKSSIFADSNIFSAIFVFVSWRSDLLLICSDWIARICWYVYSNLACFPLLSSVVIILHYYNNILHLFRQNLQKEITTQTNDGLCRKVFILFYLCIPIPS